MNSASLFAAGRRAVAIAAIVVVESAHAQVSLIGGGPSASLSNLGPQGAWVNQNIHAAGAAGGGSVSLDLTGDWSLKMPREDSEGRVRARGSTPFTVGPLPVRITDFTFTYNAKWVNGGGTATIPETWFSYQGSLWENPGFPNIFITGVGTLNESLVGNGLTIIDGSEDDPIGSILAVGANYYLELKIDTLVLLKGMTLNTPTVTVTNEFGGDLSAFDGFGVRIEYEVVPAPTASIVLAGCGALTLRRRNRHGRRGEARVPLGA